MFKSILKISLIIVYKQKSDIVYIYNWLFCMMIYDIITLLNYTFILYKINILN